MTGVRSAPGTDTRVARPILSVGDTVDGYRMPAAPDGIEADDNGDGTFTLRVHHRNGVASRWLISADDFTVLDGGADTGPGAPIHSARVDASGFLGAGWWLRLERSGVVAVRPDASQFFPIVASSSRTP